MKGHFSLILTKALRTDQRTDGQTDQRTDKASYGDARTHLKRARTTTEWRTTIIFKGENGLVLSKVNEYGGCA